MRENLIVWPQLLATMWPSCGREGRNLLGNYERNNYTAATEGLFRQGSKVNERTNTSSCHFTGTHGTLQTFHGAALSGLQVDEEVGERDNP